ncbi:VWA domain-containing protein [Terriglobus albidus]|uniref:VWA domain-containing protein n=1 Tax=Terriglobus albidus TaxID=1592106 RepID=UPI0021DF832C|nr:VWA domain-containing protein [Terriglobus albidus]
MRGRRFALIVGGFLCGTMPGQTTIERNAALVVVPVMVQTSQRDTVFGLEAKDFLVTDDGVAQTISLDEEQSLPLSLLVVMQTGGTARTHFRDYIHLSTMLNQITEQPGNRVAIMTFDSKPEAAMPFTSDLSRWNQAIDHPEQGDSGAAIFDAIATGVQLLEQQPADRRRVMLLLSQHQDNGSKAKADEILRAVGEANIQIYSLSFSAEGAKIKQAFRDPPHLNPPIPGIGQAYWDLGTPLSLAIGALQKNAGTEAATLSGGEGLPFAGRADLEHQLATITQHIRNTYLLSFPPHSSEPGLHTLNVRIPQHPELRVSARASYWRR